MFKTKFSLEERFSESQRVLQKYPDKIPIICEKTEKQIDLPVIDKCKYLVPMDYTIGQFMYIIRKRLQLNSEEALFMFVKDNILPSSCYIGQIYELYRDVDGYLYIQYAKEHTFGQEAISID